MYKKINGEKMKISKVTKLCFLAGLVLGTVIAISGSIFMNNRENYQASSSLPVKTSTIMSPIYIDDLDPNNNWDMFISENPGYLGTGEVGDPYIIYGGIIDAKGGSTGITIKNSDALFQIDSCTFFNTSQYDISAGIYLENVSYGFIMNSDFYNNGFFGIEVINSTFLQIRGNSFHNNLGTGIYLGGTSIITIAENNINNHNGNGIELYNSLEISVVCNNVSYSNYYGIFLLDTNDTEILDNRISHNFDGIALINSNHNTIRLNTISYSEENGILIQDYSNYNSIKDNMVFQALYYISIGNSSYGTYLLNNEPSLIRRFEDIPLPDPPSNGTINDESDERLGIPGYNAIFFVSITFAIIISTTMANKRMKTIRDSQNHKEF